MSVVVTVDPLQFARDAAALGEWWCYWRKPDGIERVGVGVDRRVAVEAESTVGLESGQIPWSDQQAFLTIAFDGIDGRGPWRGTSPVQLVVPRMTAERHPTSTEDAEPRKPPGVHRVSSTTSYSRRVGAALRAIDAGLVQKVVVARAETVAPADPVATLRGLRASYPDCRVFGVSDGKRSFVGATPEPLVTIEGRVLRTCALAGTSNPGDSALLHSEKDLREHRWVVESIRTALEPICDELEIPDVPSVRILPTVQHLHSPIRATLRDGVDPREAVARLHPTGAVCGEPRRAAARLIRELEPFDRGLYAGVVGWVGRDRADLAVGIRSALFCRDRTVVYAGAGIVAGSLPEAEDRETLSKLQAVGEWLTS